MTPEQLRQLERLAREAAANMQRKRDKRRGIRRKAVEYGPATEAQTVVRCATCKAPIWAQDALRRTNGDYACPAHAGEPLHASTSARTLCTHCSDSVASGVWRYGGTAFGHEWQRDAVLCAACGFDAVNWVTLIRPELPKGTQRGMTPMAVIAWHRKNPPKAARYVQWCRLLHDGREAAAAFAASVQKALEPPKREPLFDMSDPMGAVEFMRRVGLGP